MFSTLSSWLIGTVRCTSLFGIDSGSVVHSLLWRLFTSGKCARMIVCFDQSESVFSLACDDLIVYSVNIYSLSALLFICMDVLSNASFIQTAHRQTTPVHWNVTDRRPLLVASGIVFVMMDSPRNILVLRKSGVDWRMLHSVFFVVRIDRWCIVLASIFDMLIRWSMKPAVDRVILQVRRFAHQPSPVNNLLSKSKWQTCLDVHILVHCTNRCCKTKSDAVN